MFQTMFCCQFHGKIALIKLALMKSVSMQTRLKWGRQLDVGYRMSVCLALCHTLALSICGPMHLNVFSVQCSCINFKIEWSIVSIKMIFYLPMTSDRAPFAGNCIVTIVTSVVNNTISILTCMFSLSNDFVLFDRKMNK